MSRVLDALDACAEYLKGRNPALEEQVYWAVKELRPNRRKFPVDYAATARQIARLHDVPLDSLIGDSRSQKINVARFHLWSELFPNHTYVAIGRSFGRHHSTIMHGVRQWREVWQPRKEAEWKLKQLCLQQA